MTGIADHSGSSNTGAAMLMSSSSNHTLVMDTNRQLWAFGRNDNGQLGVRPHSHTKSSHNTPTAIVWSHPPIVHGALGAFHTVLLDQEGMLWISRDGVFHATNTLQWYMNEPSQIEKMDCGTTVLAIQDATGEVSIFDLNSSGSVPIRHMSTRSRVRSITCGSDHVLVESLDGELLGLGDNQMGQLGIPDIKRAIDWVPTKFQRNSGRQHLRSLSAGTNFSLLVDSQGGVWTTGSNSAGQQGPEHEGLLNPQWKLLVDLPPMKCAVAGGVHVLAIDENDNVWGWGCNSSGQLGLLDAAYRNAPQLIPQLQRIVQVKAGKTHSLAINDEGCLFVFGYNAYGQLGLADLDNRYTPVALSSLDPLLNIKPRACFKNARSAYVS